MNLPIDSVKEPRRVAICDLDNCLSDDRARIPLIDWSKSVAEGRYDAYHAACSEDGPPNPFALNWLIEKYADGADIVFCTARPVNYYTHTINWIARRVIPEISLVLGGVNVRFDIIMRNLHDHRPSVEVKRNMLASLLDPNESAYDQVAGALDDRPDVVEMYRAAGISATLHAIHDVCAYTPPPSAEQVEAVALAFGLKPEKIKRAPDLLDEGAATFRQRNAIYGDTYLNFGAAMCAAFPDGIHIEAGDVGGMNRLGVFVQVFGKLLRYAPNLAAGGHQDSAHDAMVYSAMLEEVTEEKAKP